MTGGPARRPGRLLRVSPLLVGSLRRSLVAGALLLVSLGLVAPGLPSLLTRPALLGRRLSPLGLAPLLALVGLRLAARLSLAAGVLSSPSVVRIVSLVRCHDDLPAEAAGRGLFSPVTDKGLPAGERARRPRSGRATTGLWPRRR